MPSTKATRSCGGALRSSSMNTWLNVTCQPAWSPKFVSGPNATWSRPTSSAQYSKCSMTESRQCRMPRSKTTSIQVQPPLHARISNSART